MMCFHVFLTVIELWSYTMLKQVYSQFIPLQSWLINPKLFHNVITSTEKCRQSDGGMYRIDSLSLSFLWYCYAAEELHFITLSQTI